MAALPKPSPYLADIQSIGTIFPGGTPAISSYGGPAGSFTTDNVFQPSPETERLLKYLEQREGKKINIKSFSDAPGGKDSIPSYAYGVYFHEPKVGGSSDPTARTVYLNSDKPDNNIAVLSHELGHAFDPRLADEYKAYKSSFPARAGMLEGNTALRNPVGFLNTFMLGPEVKVRLETEAQRAATENLRGIGYPTSSFTGDAWYKGYPGSFVNTGLDQAAALYSLPQNVPQGVPLDMLDTTRFQNLSSMGGGAPAIYSRRPALGPDDPEIDFTDEITRNLLQLGLDKKYRQAEEAIKSRNMKYINSRLER